MVDTVENLILDLLEWVGKRERTHQETMEAWRTSCPRLPVWEDATDRGVVETEHANGGSIVRLTPSGHALLKERRPRQFCLFDMSRSVSPAAAVSSLAWERDPRAAAHNESHGPRAKKVIWRKPRFTWSLFRTRRAIALLGKSLNQASPALRCRNLVAIAYGPNGDPIP
jgi:hypothetical protein